MTRTMGPEEPIHYSGRGKRTCPKCGGDLFRIPRRSIDRVISALSQVQRFRCHFFSCHWEGNVSLSRKEWAAFEAEANSTKGLRTRSSGRNHSRKLPRSFLVHMWLAAAGLGAVVVFTATDLFSNPEIALAERRSQQWVDTPKLADQGTRINQPPTAPNR